MVAEVGSATHEGLIDNRGRTSCRTREAALAAMRLLPASERHCAYLSVAPMINKVVVPNFSRGFPMATRGAKAKTAKKGARKAAKKTFRKAAKKAAKSA